MTLVIMGMMAAIVAKAMTDFGDKAGQPTPMDILNGTDPEALLSGPTTVPGAAGAPVRGGGVSGGGAAPASGGSVGGAAGLAGAGVAGGVVAGAAGIAATGGGGKAPSGFRGAAGTAACQGDYQSVARALATSQAAGAPATSVAALVAGGFLAIAPANPAYSIEIRPGPTAAPTVYANGQPSIAGCG